jgi:hypothetical protein
MRKKNRASLSRSQGSPDVYASCREIEIAVNSDSKSTLRNFPAGRPEGTPVTESSPGAGVELEPVFWTAMQRICEIEGFSPEFFVAGATSQYPHYGTDIAVRTAIAVYFYNRSEARLDGQSVPLRRTLVKPITRPIDAPWPISHLTSHTTQTA